MPSSRHGEQRGRPSSLRPLKRTVFRSVRYWVAIDLPSRLIVPQELEGEYRDEKSSFARNSIALSPWSGGSPSRHGGRCSRAGLADGDRAGVP
jgi:hypothetical protein